MIKCKTPNLTLLVYRADVVILETFLSFSFYIHTHIHNYLGINATDDVLSSVTTSTMALNASFVVLQGSLMMVRTQVDDLISRCNTAAMGNVAVQPVCDMIPQSSEFQTDANFNDVSVKTYLHL